MTGLAVLYVVLVCVLEFHRTPELVEEKAAAAAAAAADKAAAADAAKAATRLNKAGTALSQSSDSSDASDSDPSGTAAAGRQQRQRQRSPLAVADASGAATPSTEPAEPAAALAVPPQPPPPPQPQHPQHPHPLPPHPSLPPPQPPPPPPQQHRPLRALFLTSGYLVPAATAAVAYGGMAGLMTASPLALKDSGFDFGETTQVGGVGAVCVWGGGGVEGGEGGGGVVRGLVVWWWRAGGGGAGGTRRGKAAGRGWVKRRAGAWIEVQEKRRRTAYGGNQAFAQGRALGWLCGGTVRVRDRLWGWLHQDRASGRYALGPVNHRQMVIHCHIARRTSYHSGTVVPTCLNDLNLVWSGLTVWSCVCTQVIQVHILCMFVPSLFTGHVIQLVSARWTMALGALLQLGGNAVFFAGRSLGIYFAGNGEPRVIRVVVRMVAHEMGVAVGWVLQWEGRQLALDECHAYNRCAGKASWLLSFLPSLILVVTHPVSCCCLPSLQPWWVWAGTGRMWARRRWWPCPTSRRRSSWRRAFLTAVCCWQRALRWC